MSLAVLSGFSSKIATDLPASVGEPPPIEITAFAPNSFARAVASSTWCVVGLGVTLSKFTYPMLLSFNAFSTTSHAPVAL